MSSGSASEASQAETRREGGLLAVVRKHWGYDSLRPLQEQAMQAVLDGRDSLLVLPTGGGKSLCYQAPAVLRGELTVVISPLIALMKDQVDGLKSCGIPAVQLNSSLSPDDIREAERALHAGTVRLLYASPERMATGSFRNLLKHLGVRTFAIDEAHCISHWGHDFRPEYRQLRDLKTHFPQASIHAFTATATEAVRADIVEQLGLRKADVFVGNFDRPNLTYRVLPRVDQFIQVLELIREHKGEAGIVYCLRRADVDGLTPLLRASGIRAQGYHAGMSPDDRKAVHDQFIDEKCDVVVATVAFGMGIDRSNIRFVIHMGMPKSIEHYQQEGGRAGRDGLEAECVLLFSPGDVISWKKLMQKSVAESQADVDPEFLKSAYRHLADMESYCRPIICRHKSLVEYFGQKFEIENCGACDLCLGESEPVPDAQTIAKKILSCVFRVKEGFGAGHVTSVLRGSKAAAIVERGHDSLSTHGLLSEHSQADLRDFIQQLVGQGVLGQVGDEYPVLKLNPASWDVMNDRRSIRLLGGPKSDSTGEEKGRSKGRAVAAESWEGVDRDLFEDLRELRLELAAKKKVPPYLVFSDKTLRELARARPSSLDGMRLLYGIGEAKLKDYGAEVLERIDAQCRSRNLSRDEISAPRERPVVEAPRKVPAGSQIAANLFRKGASLAEVAKELDRAPSTVVEYFCDFLRTDRPDSITRWVPDSLYQQIVEAINRVGPGPLKPIFVALGEKVPYDAIRIVMTHVGYRRKDEG